MLWLLGQPSAETREFAAVARWSEVLVVAVLPLLLLMVLLVRLEAPALAQAVQLPVQPVLPWQCRHQKPWNHGPSW